MKFDKQHILIVIVLALALAGCLGGDIVDRLSEEQAVSKLFQELRSALEVGDVTRVKSMVADPVLMEASELELALISQEVDSQQAWLLSMLESEEINEDELEQNGVPQYLATRLLDLVELYSQSDSVEAVVDTVRDIAKDVYVWKLLEDTASEVELDPDKELVNEWLKISRLVDTGLLFPADLSELLVVELAVVEWSEGINAGNNSKWYALGKYEQDDDSRLTFEMKNSQWLVSAVKYPW